MRTWNILLIVAGMAACVGCQRPVSAVTAQPSPDELVTIERPQSHFPVSVAVAGGNTTPPRQLVPDFTVPPLTPEEQAVVDVNQTQFQLLPYALHYQPANSTVSLALGGASTAEHGWGGASVARAFVCQVSGSSTSDGGALVATSTYDKYSGAAGLTTGVIAARGHGVGGASTAEGGASHVSAVQRSEDR